MKKVIFNFDSIRQLNPGMASEIDLKMQDMIKDMRERPGDDRARKLTIVIDQVPVEDGGRLIEVNTSFDVKLSLPTARSRVHTLASKDDELALLFEPESPENARQRTFGSMADEAEEAPAPSIKMPAAAKA